MRKMRLDVEGLQVESFVTGSEDGRGTVRAHDSYAGVEEPVSQIGCTEDNCIEGKTFDCTLGCTINRNTCLSACEATYGQAQNTCYYTCVSTCEETCGWKQTCGYGSGCTMHTF